MEPGHEDREYLHRPGRRILGRAASMEPGHEDREYGRLIITIPPKKGLNGARS